MAHGDNQSISASRAAAPDRSGKTLGAVAKTDAPFNCISGFEQVSAALTSPYLAEMLDYYCTLMAGKVALPPISQFDPTALPHHLPNLHIVELRPTPDGEIDYHYRMFGTGLALLFGVDMTGKTLHAFPDQARVDRSLAVFRHIGETGLLTRVSGEARTKNGMPVRGETLVMPFGEMGTVTHIISDLDYDTD